MIYNFSAVRCYASYLTAKICIIISLLFNLILLNQSGQVHPIMKIQFALICALSVFLLTACKTNPEKATSETPPSSTAAEQPKEQSADENNGDRGFDPCKLNANLAICNKE